MHGRLPAIAGGLYLLLACSALAQSDAVRDVVRGATSQAVRGATRDAITAVLHKPTLYVDDAEDALVGSSLSPDRRNLLLIFRHQEPRLWNFANGQQYRVGSAARWSGLSLDPSARFIFGRDASGAAQAVDVLADKPVDDAAAARELLTVQQRKALFVGRGGDVAELGGGSGQGGGVRIVAAGNALGYSPDGRLAAVPSGGGMALVSAETLKEAGEIALPDVPGLAMGDIRIPADGNPQKVSYVAIADGAVYAKLGSGGKPLRLVLPGRALAAGLVDGKEQAVSVTASGELVISAADGKPLSSVRNELISHAVRVWTYKQGAIAVVLRDDGRLIALDRLGKLAFMALSTRSGWAVIDGRGRYDDSSGGRQRIGWSIADMRLAIDHFAREYFEPGLLALYTTETGRFLAPGPFDFAQGVPLPPAVVSLSLKSPSRDAGTPNQVIITARDADGPVQGIDLYQNGKRLPPADVLFDETRTEGRVTVRGLAFNVRPVVGRNEFRAVPIGLGAIEGQDVTMAESFTGSAATESLHVLVVGIDDYAVPGFHLDYASTDAAHLLDQLRSSARRFGRIAVYKLVDKDATKEGILAAFARLKAEAKPEDTVVLYFAGHGIVLDDEWYFVAQNVEARTVEGVKRAGLSSKDLYDAIVGVPAEKVFLMMDACYSGAVTERLDRFAAQRASAVIGRMSGVAVLAASRADQEAYEAAELGGGLFTYVVVRGLKGAADKAKRGTVEVAELIEYAEDVLPRLFRDKLKEPQIPEAFFGGTDFYLSSSR